MGKSLEKSKRCEKISSSEVFQEYFESISLAQKKGKILFSNRLKKLGFDIHSRMAFLNSGITDWGWQNRLLDAELIRRWIGSKK